MSAKADRSEEIACPLAGVDKRLADSHRLWHLAETSYFDPDGFRLAAQMMVQTLRTITFVLQKHKSHIPDFDAWYAAWVSKMATDPLMRWMVDARNRIEKEGDLQTKSFVRADIVASYLDEGPGIEVPAELFASPLELLRRIPEGAVREHVRKHGTLRIRRRWVENTLPDFELLEALAIVYGRLAEIVHDAHRQMELPEPQTISDVTGKKFDLRALGWRMPCMIAHDEPRTLLMSLADGSRIEFEKKQASIDTAKIPDLKARYGDMHAAMGGTYDSYDDLAKAYFEMVREVFLRDGYHQPILFLFREMKLVGLFATRAENPQQKYLLMRSMANEVLRNLADAAILVDEIWFAPAADLKPYQRPADLESKREALVLNLVRREGEPVEFMAEILRHGDAISLGETSVVKGGAPFMFAPFYAAWKRDIPAKWLRWTVETEGVR